MRDIIKILNYEVKRGNTDLKYLMENIHQLSDRDIDKTKIKPSFKKMLKTFRTKTKEVKVLSLEELNDIESRIIDGAVEDVIGDVYRTSKLTVSNQIEIPFGKLIFGYRHRFFYKHIEIGRINSLNLVEENVPITEYYKMINQEINSSEILPQYDAANVLSYPGVKIYK